jgi:hypothetical protein
MSDIKLPELPELRQELERCIYAYADAIEAGGGDEAECQSEFRMLHALDRLEMRAKRAAELERECCIAFLMKLHEEAQGSHNYFKWAANKFRRLIGGSAAEIERDACVAVCMGMQNGWPSDDQIACAEAIRARGAK